MVKLSVIIPIYNAEKYIKDCLDSITNQSLKDIEIICVDDGSVDNTLEILNEYALRDCRIKILTQENKFAGVARNYGITVATGEYLHFMNADDILFEGIYENLMMLCEQKQYPNIVRFRAQAFDDSTGEYVEKKYYEMTNIESKLNSYLDVNNDLESIFMLSVTPWQGIIKRDFVFKNELMFNNLRCCNDRSFFITSVLKSQEIFVSDILGVNHRVNNSSSLVGIRSKNFDCHCKSLEIIVDFCQKNNVEKSILHKIVLNELSDMFVFYRRFFNSPDSYNTYKLLSVFIKNLDKDLISEDVRNVWYYSDYLELLNVSSKCIGIKYFIKKYIFNVIDINPGYYRYVLFGCIKFKRKRIINEKK